MGKPLHNWAKLKQAYVIGDETIAEFARKYQVPERSIYEHYTRECWRLERERFRMDTAEKLQAKAQEEVLSAMPSLVEVNAEYIARNREQGRLLDKCTRRLDAQDKLNHEALELAVSIGGELLRNARMALGVVEGIPQSPKLSRYETMDDDTLIAELMKAREQTDAWLEERTKARN